MAKIYKKRWELSTTILEKDLLEIKKKQDKIQLQAVQPSFSKYEPGSGLCTGTKDSPPRHLFHFCAQGPSRCLRGGLFQVSSAYDFNLMNSLSETNCKTRHELQNLREKKKAQRRIKVSILL